MAWIVGNKNLFERRLFVSSEVGGRVFEVLNFLKFRPGNSINESFLFAGVASPEDENEIFFVCV